MRRRLSAVEPDLPLPLCASLLLCDELGFLTPRALAWMTACSLPRAQAQVEDLLVIGWVEPAPARFAPTLYRLTDRGYAALSTRVDDPRAILCA